MRTISILTFLLTSCVSSWKGDFQKDFPKDLTIDLLVAVDSQFSMKSSVKPQRVELRSMRLTIWPDGSLGFENKEGLGPFTSPQTIRILDAYQMKEIWSGLQKFDLSQTLSNSFEMENNLKPSFGGRVVRLSILQNKKRFCYVDYTKFGQKGNVELQKAIRFLSHYAWASDQTSDFYTPPPLRFDLGDDPYEEFYK